MIKLFIIAIRPMSITICLLLLLETFQRYKSSHLYKYKTRLISMDIHIYIHIYI